MPSYTAAAFELRRRGLPLHVTPSRLEAERASRLRLAGPLPRGGPGNPVKFCRDRPTAAELRAREAAKAVIAGLRKRLPLLRRKATHNSAATWTG